MFSVSKLTEEQKNKIKLWAASGDQLAELQKKINTEFGLSATYLDTRFAILDLGIELETKNQEPVPEKQKPERVALGYVDATVDQIVRAGYYVSGSVTFSDGMQGLWGIDESGRLALDMEEAGYKPTDEDMLAFQEVLRTKLQAKRD